MILMPMGKQKPTNLVLIFCQVRYIRYDIINPQHIGLRKSHPAVHNDDIIFIFNHRHIFANLADASQRDDTYRRLICVGLALAACCLLCCLSSYRRLGSCFCCFHSLCARRSLGCFGALCFCRRPSCTAPTCRFLFFQVIPLFSFYKIYFLSAARSI